MDSTQQKEATSHLAEPSNSTANVETKVLRSSARVKAAKEKEKEKEKDADKEGGDKDAKDSERKKASPPGSLSPPSNASPAPAMPTHQRYTLHRDIFALRLAEHRRRRQAAQAKELAPRLPGAPMTPLP